MFSFLRLSFTGRHVHIKANNITRSEFPIFNLLGGSLLINNNIVTVDKMLLDSVRKNSLDWVAFELCGCFCDGLSDLLISASFFNRSQGSLEGGVSCHDDVCFAACGFSLSDKYSSGSICGKAVNVSTANDLRDVSLSK